MVTKNKYHVYRGLYEVLRGEKFVGTSQKSSGKSRPASGRDDDKGAWDGTKSHGENISTAEGESTTNLETGKKVSEPLSSNTVKVARKITQRKSVLIGRV